MIHYAGLSETRTACELPCRAPSEEEHISHQYTLVAYTFETGERAGFIRSASLDPRLVDCPVCVANLPELPACHCGAPALYGAKLGKMLFTGTPLIYEDPQYCAEHCPADCRCQSPGCRKPLLDASDSFCAACLDPDTGDGITAEIGFAT